MSAPDLRADVRTMQGLRELAGYVPVDTRPDCPCCGEQCCVLWTVVPAEVAGIKPKPFQECGRCHIERLGR